MKILTDIGNCKIKKLMITILITICFVFSTQPVSAAVPDTLTRVLDGQWTLQLTKENFRGSNFEVLVQNSQGGYDPYDHGEVRTFIGTVDEDPAATAVAYYKQDGVLLASIIFDRGNMHMYDGNTLLKSWGWYDPTFRFPTQPTVSAGHAGTTMYEYGIGYDIAYDGYSTIHGSNTQTAVNYIEYDNAFVAHIHMSEFLAKPVVERVIIRASQTHCPYEATSGLEQLGTVSAEWTNNHSDAVAYCFKMALNTPDIGGGVAQGGGQFTVNAMDIYGNSSDVFRHEIGHNWGIADYDAGSPEGATINCGNGYARHSGPGVEDALNHRDWALANTTYLTSIGTYTAVDITPYASLDTVRFIADGSSNVTVDVLANDFDANADSLSIISFDSVTANGNSLSLSSGTGPGGRDEITCALGNELGLDTFYYTIQDSTGLTASGVVMVLLEEQDGLKGHWRLDETIGTKAQDSSLYGLEALLITDTWEGFDTRSVPGKFGTAVYLDGGWDYLWVDPVDYTGIEGNTLTISAWVKLDSGPQTDWAGILFARDDGPAGLDMRSTRELRYGWGGVAWPFASGLIIPADQWTFVALVVEPAKATLYLHDGTTLQSAVNIATHNPLKIINPLIGYDASFGGIKGSVDDVRIFDVSLSRPEIEAIIAGGSARYPNPYDGSLEVDSELLQWDKGLGATSQDVYVGTDLTSVTNATTASPEYQGPAYGEYYVADLSASMTYYWRVDTVTASQTLTGDVWTLTTSSTLGAFVPHIDFIDNPSFETDDISGSGWAGAITDWYEKGNCGIVLEDGNQYPLTPYGTNWAFLYPGGTIYQQVGTWGANVNCSIDLRVGSEWGPHWNSGNPGLYDSRVNVELWAGGTPTSAADGTTPSDIGAVLVAGAYNVGINTNGNGSDVSVVLNTGTSAALGDALWLVFTTNDTDAYKLIDNINILVDLYDGKMGLEDLSEFAGHWLDTGCIDFPPCGGCDLDADNTVDMRDFAIFAENWLLDVQ